MECSYAIPFLYAVLEDALEIESGRKQTTSYRVNLKGAFDYLRRSYVAEFYSRIVRNGDDRKTAVTDQPRAGTTEIPDRAQIVATEITPVANPVTISLSAILAEAAGCCQSSSLEQLKHARRLCFRAAEMHLTKNERGEVIDALSTLAERTIVLRYYPFAREVVNKALALANDNAPGERLQKSLAVLSVVKAASVRQMDTKTPVSGTIAAPQCLRQERSGTSNGQEQQNSASLQRIRELNAWIREIKAERAAIKRRIFVRELGAHNIEVDSGTGSHSEVRDRVTGVKVMMHAGGGEVGSPYRITILKELVEQIEQRAG